MIKLPIKRKKGRVFIEPELASNILPIEVRTGLSLASVTGELEVKDNVYTIKVILCTENVKTLFLYALMKDSSLQK